MYPVPCEWRGDKERPSINLLNRDARPDDLDPTTCTKRSIYSELYQTQECGTAAGNSSPSVIEKEQRATERVRTHRGWSNLY